MITRSDLPPTLGARTSGGHIHATTRNLADPFDPVLYPVVVWDGVTFYEESGYRWPSSSTTKRLPVVGPGTRHALRLDPATYMALWWGVEQLEFDITGGAASGTAGAATASATDEFDETFTATAGESTLTRGPLFPGDDNVSNIVEGSVGLFSTRAQRPASGSWPPTWGPTPPFNYQRARLPEDNLVLVPRLLWYRSDTLDRTGMDLIDSAVAGPRRFESVQADASDGDDYVSASTHAHVNAGFIVEHELNRWFTNALYVPESGEEPAGFWLPAPFLSFGIEVGASSRASAEEPPGGSPEGNATNSRTVTLILHTSDDPAIPPTGSPATIPISYEPAPGVLATGLYLASLDVATTELSTGSGASAGACEATISAPPEIVVRPVKWFTYGGRWNATTGRRAG